MILYHFTAKHLAKKIKKQGLTLGAIPVSLNPPQIKNGYVWLTCNPDWHQECLRGTGLLPYKRNEVRFTVKIPENKNSQLLKFDKNKDLTPIYDDLTAYGDPENWFVYEGIVPRGWLIKTDFNPQKESLCE